MAYQKKRACIAHMEYKSKTNTGVNLAKILEQESSSMDNLELVKVDSSQSISGNWHR